MRAYGTSGFRLPCANSRSPDFQTFSAECGIHAMQDAQCVRNSGNPQKLRKFRVSSQQDIVALSRSRRIQEAPPKTDAVSLLLPRSHLRCPSLQSTVGDHFSHTMTNRFRLRTCHELENDIESLARTRQPCCLRRHRDRRVMVPSIIW